MATTTRDHRRRTLERRTPERRGERAGRKLTRRDGEPASLEDFVLGASRRVRAGMTTTCPVCSSHELDAAGCPSCGSSLH